MPKHAHYVSRYRSLPSVLCEPGYLWGEENARCVVCLSSVIRPANTSIIRWKSTTYHGGWVHFSRWPTPPSYDPLQGQDLSKPLAYRSNQTSAIRKYWERLDERCRRVSLGQRFCQGNQTVSMHSQIIFICNSWPSVLQPKPRPMALALDGWSRISQDDRVCTCSTWWKGNLFPPRSIYSKLSLFVQVLPYCFRPHSTHLCQPLDVVLFGPTQKAYGLLVLDEVRRGNKVGKEDFSRYGAPFLLYCLD